MKIDFSISKQAVSRRAFPNEVRASDLPSFPYEYTMGRLNLAFENRIYDLPDVLLYEFGRGLASVAAVFALCPRESYLSVHDTEVTFRFSPNGHGSISVFDDHLGIFLENIDAGVFIRESVGLFTGVCDELAERLEIRDFASFSSLYGCVFLIRSFDMERSPG
jgi:hypothetical protein